MISLPDEFMSTLSCDAQQLLHVGLAPLLAALGLWLLVRAAHVLAVRSVPTAQKSAQAPSTTHAHTHTRAANAAAAVSCGLLPMLVLGLPWLLPADADWPAPVLLALRWRWLALLPALLWALGLLRRGQPSPHWARACALAAGLACVLLLGIANLAYLKLGCMV